MVSPDAAVARPSPPAETVSVAAGVRTRTPTTQSDELERCAVV